MTSIKLFGALGIFLAIGISSGLWMSSRHASEFEGPWIFGQTGARFTITEYADLECPYCKEYFPQLKSWVEKHADVNLVWNHLPLQMHEPAAGHEARLAECVGSKLGSGGFWAVTELIYDQTASNGRGIGAGALSAAADPTLAKAIKACSTPNPTFAERVALQAAKAKAAGIEATPTIVITDNLTQKSLKLVGISSSDTLLSAVDWLSSSALSSEQASITH